jgi:hypothetical protein
MMKFLAFLLRLDQTIISSLDRMVDKVVGFKGHEDHLNG